MQNVNATPAPLYTVKLTKFRATWHWFTENPVGGGFGSNNCGPKKDAISRALRGVPVGAAYVVVTNGVAGKVEVRQ